MSKSEYRAIAFRQRCGTAVYNLLRPELPVETSTAVSTRKVNIKKPKNFQKELRKLLKEIQSSRKTPVFESGLKSDSLGTNERSEAEGKLNTKRFGKCVYSIETGGSKCKGRSRTYSNGVECKSKHFANQLITCKSTKTSDEKRKDFIKENKLAIKNIISPRRGPNHDENSISNHAIHHSSYGRIPSYLISRKKNLTNIKNVLMEATDSETYTDSIPKGMSLLQEDERVETLVLLYQSEENVEREIRGIFDNLTPKVKRDRQRLESKLLEIKKAIEIFKKKKVYIFR